MDELRKKSDKELEKMEKKLSKIYKTAEKEISESWNKYMEKASAKLEKLEKAYADAKASGDADLIHKTGFELGKEKKLQTVQNSRYKAMTEETAKRLSNVNQVALDYINGEMPKIYTMNHNETLGEIETEVGKVGVSRSFSLMDENTAKNLVKSDTSLFPQKVIDRAKDEKWNLKAINSQVLQGLLQGESIDKISARLQNVTDMNSAAAVRNARTMCTAAENNGRMSGMKEAEAKGIVYEKQWMATHDDRTRESHAELDGVSVGLDEEFPNGLQYPGDPAGDPEEVYNCRCSMVRKLIGFRRKDGSISEVDIEDEYKPDYFDTNYQPVKESELPENFRKEADQKEEKEVYIPNLDNVVEFNGKQNVKNALESMNPSEAKVWNNYSKEVNYKIITEEESETAFFMAGTKDVSLFDYSTENTFFHETAHALDDESITGTVEIRGSRKLIGSDEWSDIRPYVYEINGASRAAQEIYDMNEHAWGEDNNSFIAWAKMENEDDLKSLIHSVREFEKEYGEAAAGVLGDLIDAHTIGKYPMSVFAGGHGRGYWERDASLASKEAWAEISSLKAQGKQDAIDVLAQILPNRVTSTETLYDIVFKGGADYEHRITDKTDTRVSETIWRFRKKS